MPEQFNSQHLPYTGQHQLTASLFAWLPKDWQTT